MNIHAIQNTHFGVVCQRRASSASHQHDPNECGQAFTIQPFRICRFYFWSTLPPSCFRAIVSLTSIVFLIDCICSLRTPDVYVVDAVTITQHTAHTTTCSCCRSWFLAVFFLRRRTHRRRLWWLFVAGLSQSTALPHAIFVNISRRLCTIVLHSA